MTGNGALGAAGTLPEDPLDGLPPSARNVYRTLAEQGPLTHKDLLATTGMPGRTVRYAVSRLKKAGLVDARCNLMDCRQCFFFLRRQCAGRAPATTGSQKATA